MSKLRSVHFDNFESLFANTDGLVGLTGLNSDSGWQPLTSGADPFFSVSTTTPVEGLVSIAVGGVTVGVPEAIFVVRETSDGLIVSYELRWSHQNTAAAYNVATNRPFWIWVENNAGGFPWYVEIHKNALKVFDNAGLSASVANPGTTPHKYRMTDDGAGNIELFVDGGSVHVGTAIAIAPTNIDRIVMSHKADPANGGFNIFTGHIDLINLLQTVSATFNVARIAVGK